MFARSQSFSFRALLALVAIAIVATLMPAGVAQAAAASDGVAVNPATAGGPDKSRTRFDYQLNPSQPAEDSVYVYNTGTTDQEVTLYARDAFGGAKGEFLIQDEKVQPTDAGSWVTFVNKKTTYVVTLKPHGYVTIPFTVNTPANATPGDHVGAIVASAITKGSALNIIRRVAVRLYARVSGQVSPRLELSNLQVTNSASAINPFDSTVVVSYDIENTGNVDLSADLTVQPTGIFGVNTADQVITRITNLLPGSKRHLSQTITGLTQTGTSGVSVTYTGILSQSYATSTQPRGRVDEASFVLPTAWLLWLGALLALIVIWALIARARRSRPMSEQEHASID
jgi:dihydroorotate dehydrogenase (fumarate)